MRAHVLIAEELRDLLDRHQLQGMSVRWLGADAPTPAGRFVAIVPLLSRRIGRDALQRLPALQIIANCAVGVDNVDLNAAAERGVVVTNTPDVLTEATADLTWALILAAARRLKEGQSLIARGGWRGWHPTELLGMELAGGTLGIVGAGRIGGAVARRAVGFRMRLLYWSRSVKPELERDTGAERAALERVLAQSDVVSLHLPSTDETRGLISRERLARMKPGALLVNTARGDLVDEDAVCDALEAGSLGGAGLDVFAHEPAIPERLRRHPRAVLLPHVGSATHHTRGAMAGLAVRNILAVLAGDAPLTPVS